MVRVLVFYYPTYLQMTIYPVLTAFSAISIQFNVKMEKRLHWFPIVKLFSVHVVLDILLNHYRIVKERMYICYFLALE